MKYFCSKCGAEITENETYCGNCGASNILHSYNEKNNNKTISLNYTQKKKTTVISIVSIIAVILVLLLYSLFSNTLKGDWQLYMSTKSGNQQQENEIWTFDGTKFGGKNDHIYYYEKTDDKIFFSENPNNIRENYYKIIKLTSKEMELESSNGKRRYFLKKV